MGELAKRATEFVANAAGSYVNTAVAALMTLAAAVTKNPDLAILAVPAAAVAGAGTETAVTSVRRLWATEGVGDLADAVSEEMGEPIETVLENLQDRKAYQLLGQCVACAVDGDGWKVRVLARAFTVGARDADNINHMKLLVTALSDFDALDARCLAALTRMDKHSVTLEELGYGGDRDLVPVAPLVLEKLVRLGIATYRPVSVPAWSVTPYGRALADLLKKVDNEHPIDRDAHKLHAGGAGGS